MPLCNICGNARSWKEFSEVEAKKPRLKRKCQGCERMLGTLSKQSHILKDNQSESHLVYKTKFFNTAEANTLTERLYEELPWDWTYYEQDGAQIRSPRKMIWVADDAEWVYRFSSNHNPGLIPIEWTETLLEIKARVEEYTGGFYNAVLANLYENVTEVSNWHSDDDPWLDFPMPFDVPSVSFGFERNFCWRKKDNWADEGCIILEHGSIVIMNGNFQVYYQHSVPVMGAMDSEEALSNSSPFPFRINLTFRHIKKPSRDPTKESWSASSSHKEPLDPKF